MVGGDTSCTFYLFGSKRLAACYALYCSCCEEAFEDVLPPNHPFTLVKALSFFCSDVWDFASSLSCMFALYVLP